MEWIKEFIKAFKEENEKNKIKWTKKDYLALIVIFIIGFFFGDDIKTFLDSLFN